MHPTSIFFNNFGVGRNRITGQSYGVRKREKQVDRERHTDGDTDSYGETENETFEIIL